MNTLIFPADFKKENHRIPGAVQFKPKENQPVFISIVGGAQGLYGNGKTSFEIMIGERVEGWQSVEDINKILSEVIKLIKQ